MLEQPIYVKLNSQRKNKYFIQTDIVSSNSKLYVYKRAIKKESVPFVNNINNIYEELKSRDLPFEINKVIQTKNGKIQFEYLDGISFLRELEIAAKNANPNQCIDLIKELEEILNKLPSKKATLSNNFLSIFGKEHNETYDLIDPGILDLNLDNLIRLPTGKACLIDYEWSFSFGIPKRYILFRAIYSSYIKVNPKLEKIISFKDLLKEFKFTEEEECIYYNWEKNFQRTVLKDDLADKTMKSLYEDLKRSDTVSNHYLEEVKLLRAKKILFEKYRREKQELKKQLEKLNKDNLELKNGVEKLNKDNLELKNGVEKLNRNNKKLKSQLEILNKDVQEFQSFKKGIIWNSLMRWREIKKKFTNTNKE